MMYVFGDCALAARDYGRGSLAPDFRSRHRYGSVIIAAHGGATRVITDFQQILLAARQLPKSSQAKLVSALLHENGTAGIPTLEPLTGLSEAELRTLATSVLAPAHARRLKQLLRLNREKQLTYALQAELDTLLTESDRLAVVKAKATYTLSLLKA